MHRDDQNAPITGCVCLGRKGQLRMELNSANMWVSHKKAPWTVEASPLLNQTWLACIRGCSGLLLFILHYCVCAGTDIKLKSIVTPSKNWTLALKNTYQDTHTRTNKSVENKLYFIVTALLIIYKVFRNGLFWQADASDSWFRHANISMRCCC